MTRKYGGAYFKSENSSATFMSLVAKVRSIFTDKAKLNTGVPSETRVSVREPFVHPYKLIRMPNVHSYGLAMFGRYLHKFV